VDKIFVQFAEHFIPAFNGERPEDVTGISRVPITFLSNGFSHVYDECKNIGDFFWADLDPCKMEESKLPISKGEVFVSCFYPKHVFQAFYWANSYSNLKITIGGPAVRNHLRGFPRTKIPKNIEIKAGMAENELFGKNIHNRTWHLDPPKKMLNYSIFSYTINRECYWKNCIFCGTRWKGLKKDPFQNTLDSLVVPEDKRRRWKIWLVTPCLRPTFIASEFPKVSGYNRENYTFSTHIRADKAIVSALESTLSKCFLENENLPFDFRVGVEFPSERMLEIIRKGTTTEMMLKTIKTIVRYNCRLRISLIIGWNILTMNDVEEVRTFAQRVRDIVGDKKIGASIYYLVGGLKGKRVARNPVFEANKAKYRLVQLYGDSLFRYQGYIPILSKKQKELNRLVRNIYEENFDAFFYRPSLIEEMLEEK